jgi:non-canonical purine NTP pyrophosphatase (RdgB/HAM1 family)
VSLVLATRNPHKAREFAALLDGIDVVPLPAGVELPAETGESFAANALPKARAAARATGRPAFADDSGIEAAALGGAPGVRSARFAGDDASDAENLARLVAEAPPGSALQYVCVIALVDPDTGEEHLFEGRCTGTMAPAPRGTGGFGYDPIFVPDDRDDGRTMAELDQLEKDAISHRGRAARALLGHLQRTPPARLLSVPRQPVVAPSKTGAAGLSILSNSALIILKAIAGTVTGSVALLTEALHSATDLIASIVAFFSVRAADVPADETHPYGHEKIEDMAAAIEGVLILVGCGLIAFEAIRNLVRDTGVQRLGIGIAVLAVSIVVNFVVARTLRRRATLTGSPALAADAAHLTTDMATSAAVLGALALVTVTGWEWLDPAIALVVAAIIGVAGVRILRSSSRVLVDETLPDPELEVIREVVAAFADHGIVGYHELRGRQAGARRHVDLHVQFRDGTTLEDAHRTAHELQDAIRERLGHADVLIHLEPQDRVRPGEEITTGERPTRRPRRG